MEKLKNMFKDASELIKKTYYKFPITIVIVFALTAFYTFAPESIIEAFYDNELYAVVILGALGTFFAEIWFVKNNLIKIVSSCVSFIIAIIFKTIGDLELSNAGEILFRKIFLVYVSTLELLTFYKIMKNENVNLPEYGIKILSNWGKCTLTYILANIGIGMVVGAFVALILDGEGPDGIYRIFVLLGGAYYVPALINSITDMSGEHGIFVKKLIKNVFTPVIAFLLVIFYLFIGKLVLEGTLLESAMFLPLSWGFSVGLPVVLLRKNYDDNESTKRFTNILIYAFIPFILLQFIGLNIRVSDYGLTTERYMGYVLIIFEIVFIALSIIKESKYLREIFIFAIVLVYICVLSPLNCFDVPGKSQLNRLENMLAKGKFESLSLEDKKEIKTIYLYINRNDGEDLLKERFTETELKLIEEYEIPYEDDYYENEDLDIQYLSVRRDIDGADISEYTRIYSIDSIYDEQEDYSKILLEPSYNSKDEAKELYDGLYADFSLLMDSLIDEHMTYDEDEYFEKDKNNIVKTNKPNVDLYITSLRFDYSPYVDFIEYFSCDGYILVK